MKNKPLRFQLSLIISIMTISIFMLTFATINISIKNFFEEQTFEIIENSQMKKLENNKKLNSKDLNSLEEIFTTESSPSALQYEKSVIHKIIPKKLLLNSSNFKKNPLLTNISKTALSQEEISKKYIFKGKDDIFCLITKQTINEKEIFFISYMHDVYMKGLSNNLSKNILFIISISTLISVLVASIISKRITSPLTKLEKKFNLIANKKWQESLVIDRGDEIGNLSRTAQRMQESLKEKETEERIFIQTISHDLKTPIMVIRSYSQAILDEIISIENSKDTIKLIDSEAKKLNDKVKKLLYLYSLRNDHKKISDLKAVKIDDFIKNVINRMKYSKENIVFKHNLENHILNIDEESLAIVIENILDNAFRFVISTIKINFFKEDKHYKIEIFNDGPNIKNINEIFNFYSTESRGNTGLGLSIAKEIVLTHGGEISARNEDNGVTFIIKL